MLILDIFGKGLLHLFNAVCRKVYGRPLAVCLFFKIFEAVFNHGKVSVLVSINDTVVH